MVEEFIRSRDERRERLQQVGIVVALTAVLRTDGGQGSRVAALWGQDGGVGSDTLTLLRRVVPGPRTPCRLGERRFGVVAVEHADVVRAPRPDVGRALGARACRGERSPACDGQVGLDVEGVGQRDGDGTARRRAPPAPVARPRLVTRRRPRPDGQRVVVRLRPHGRWGWDGRGVRAVVVRSGQGGGNVVVVVGAGVVRRARGEPRLQGPPVGRAPRERRPPVARGVAARGARRRVCLVVAPPARVGAGPPGRRVPRVG